MCVFSGRPYSDLQDEEAELRSKDMQREQEGVERGTSDVKSPRSAARRLPIARSKYEMFVDCCLHGVSWKLKQGFCLPPSLPPSLPLPSHPLTLLPLPSHPLTLLPSIPPSLSPFLPPRNALLREINTKPVVVVMGMTGSGKTTQVPQYILENYIGRSSQ